MGEIMFAGVSHHPGFSYPDEHMADILRMHLKSDRVPSEAKDPATWPALMAAEFGVDGATATATATRHRAKVMGAYRQVRERIDAFKPDVIVIWGDDQYENFTEDLVPPFCVYAHDQFVSTPHAKLRGWVQGSPGNVWDEPKDMALVAPGHPEAAKHLTRRLLEDGYAMPYSYKPLHSQGLAHSFVNTLLYLDYDRTGFDYPVVPFHVNCYGSSFVRNKGGDTLNRAVDSEPDPPAPPPRLCFDVGAAAARIMHDSPWRVAFVATSSWSHAFITEKHHFLYPDVEADTRRFEELRDGRFGAWRDISIDEIEACGQHELLNWVCLTGAMPEMGATPEMLDFSPSYIFNSSKCTMVAGPV